MPKSILFITRNYPPKVGGLEEYSYHLIREFETFATTYKITSSKPKKHLFWFFPYSLIKALYLIRKHGIDSVHLCDGVLSPIGVILKHLTGVKASAAIHGLDITYDNPIYQRVIPWCVGRMDKIVCVSAATRNEVLKRIKIPSDKCAVIPNGIVPDRLYVPQSKSELLQKIETFVPVSLTDKKILLTVGHLVKRKGVSWFVDKVMPDLGKEYVYLIVGHGPEKRNIERAIARHHLGNQVFLLGKTSDDVRNAFYNAADIFIMPNVTVQGDMEGFGISALEAGSCGLPVVASHIEGIRDAVIDGKTGFLIEERDADGFLERIHNMDLKKEDVGPLVNDIFHWSKISAQYQAFFNLNCPF